MTGSAVGLDLPPSGSIVAIELHRVRLPLREPFVAAHGTEHDREVVLVHVVGDDGEGGWGECVALSEPTYSAETTDSAWRVLEGAVGPAVLAGTALAGTAEPATATAPRRATEPAAAAGAGAAALVVAHPMAWTAVEVALVDLALRRTDRRLVDVLGGVRAPLAACAVVGLQPSVDVTVAAVGRRVDEGYRAVKLKIEPGRDLDRLAAVRAAFPDLGLAADANGSFRSGDRAHLADAGPIGLDYLEQPLRADDLDGSARLQEALPFPIALDESVASVADLERAIAAGAGSVLNLKPGRVGGLAASSALLRAAADAGWDVFVGGMLETGVGRATALAVAAHPVCTLPTDLGPSTRYFVEDLTDPVPLEDGGRLRPPDGPGIGAVPDADRLARATVDHVVLRP